MGDPTLYVLPDPESDFHGKYIRGTSKIGKNASVSNRHQGGFPAVIAGDSLSMSSANVLPLPSLGDRPLTDAQTRRGCAAIPTWSDRSAFEAQIRSIARILETLATTDTAFIPGLVP